MTVTTGARGARHARADTVDDPGPAAPPAGPPAPRSAAQRTWARATVAYLWVGQLVFLLLAPSPVSSGDSEGYRDSTHRNMEMLLSSLQGRTVRSPAIVVPFVLLGRDTAIMVGQTLLLGLAFTFVILTVYRFTCLGTWAKAVLGLLLVTLALAPALLSWNVQILSESLSMTYVLVALAAGLRYLLRLDARWLLLAAVATALAVAAKPPMAVVLVPVLAGELVLLAVLTWRRRRDGVLPGRDLWGAVVVVVAACLLTGAGLSYASRTADARLAAGVPNQKDSLVHLISDDDPINGSIRASLRAAGVPRCLPLGQAVPIGQVFVLEDRLTARCPAFTQWALHHYDTWYAGFVLSHPGQVHRYLSDLLPYAVTFHLVEPVVSASVPPLSALVWGTSAVPTGQATAASGQLPPLSFTDLVYAAVVVANAAGLWLLLGRRRRRVGAEGRRLLWCLLYVIDAAAVVIVWQALFMPASGLEVARLALEANVAGRVALVMVLGLVATAMVGLWRPDRPPATGAGEVDPAAGPADPPGADAG